MLGVDLIAEFLGWDRRQAYHALSHGRVPGAFKMGSNWCARRSTILEGIRRLEKGAA
jgi:hypothetical protein